MRKVCIIKWSKCILASTLLCASVQAVAQSSSATGNEDTTIPSKERWAFKTNAVQWIGLTPNIGVEMDVSNSIYNKWTIGIQAAWNGHAEAKSGRKFNFTLNDYRIETRRYFKPSLKIKDSSKRIPKFWRGYYLGVYVGYTEGNFLMRNGLYGKAAHAGVTGGWEVQLYRCKHGSIDLDLGLSIGAVYAKYDKYKVDGETLEYTKQRDWRFVKYPLPTDLRIGLNYRFKSIKEKYNRTKTK